MMMVLMIAICYMIQLKIKQEGKANQLYVLLFMGVNSVLAFEWDILTMPHILKFPARYIFIKINTFLFSIISMVMSNEVVNLFGMTRRLYKNLLNVCIWAYLLTRMYHKYGRLHHYLVYFYRVLQ